MILGTFDYFWVIWVTMLTIQIVNPSNMGKRNYIVHDLRSLSALCSLSTQSHLTICYASRNNAIKMAGLSGRRGL